jgi:hypothetical protein
MKNTISLALAATLFAGATYASQAQDPSKAPARAAPAQAAPAAPAATDDASVIQAQLPSYPLKACPCCDAPLGDKPVDVVVNGRLVRVCAQGCVETAKTKAAESIAKIDAGVIAAQKASYPLTTCPVKGEPLGEDAVDVVAGTKLVRVCCKRCAGAVQKDATAAMAKVDAGWIEAGKKTYKVDVCPVSGEKLGSMGDPVDVLYGTRLVRLCCKSCTKEMRKDGAAVVAKVDALAAGAK